MSRLIVRKSVFGVSLGLILYYLLMELHYYYFVGISYLRFQMVLDVNIDKYIETKFLFLLMLIFSFYISKKSEFIYSIFIFFTIFFLVPGLVTYSFEDEIPEPLYATVALLVAIGLVSTQKVKIPDLRSITISRGVIIVLILLVLLPVIYSFGLRFNINNFLLDDIIETRSFFNDNSSPIINYLYNWLVRVISPVFLIYFLIRKQYRYALINLFILLYLYVISGNKTVYITAFVVLFFYYFGKDHIEKSKVFIFALIVILILIPIVDYYLLESHKLKGNFVMRMLFLPSHLNYFYFDLFKDHPLFFAESAFFKWFTHYPYDTPIGFVISEIYFAAPDMNSNNGIISDGYMNLGFWGVGLNIIIVSLIFLFFNSLNLEAGYLGIFFLVIFLLLSAPMLSMFITSGLWILILMGMTTMKNRP